MIIERGNIRLVRLTENYIELVRQKRNLPEIQQRMEYREYITPQMQQKWFASINNDTNFFFLISVNGSFIGLLSATNIDWRQGIVNNGGIFIWDDHYLNSPEILQSSILLTDFGYYIGLRKNYIYILKDNSKSILFNNAIGYKLLPGQEDIYNQKYELTTNTYFSATEKIRHRAELSGKIRMLVQAAERPMIEKIIDLENNKYIRDGSIEIIFS